MSKFNRGDRSGGSRGGKKYGGRDSRDRGYGGRDSDRPTMHKAVCDDCGNDCEVPFRPTSGKPIYCHECFGQHKEEGSERSGRRDSRDSGFGGRDSGRSSMHQAVCDDCGNDCEVPFKPTAGKPIYCEQCFGKGDKGRGKSDGGSKPGQDKGQLEAINAKLDKIIKLLTPVGATAPVQKTKAVKEVKPVKLKKKVKKKKIVKKAVKKKPATKNK